MKEKMEDNPPHSRIFILHSKDSSKEDLRSAFEKFGTIEDIWMVKDRNTGDAKGVTYIKYSKMSEAAAATDEMNGFIMDGHPRPLKVIIANSRDQGSKRDDNESDRLLRLFIVVPKDSSITEETLRNYFKQFGEVDYVLMLRDRDTNESKGFAYIKYFRVYHTAKALEECDRKYKAVLARPKEKRDHSGYDRAMKEYQYNVAPVSPRSKRDSHMRGPPLPELNNSYGRGFVRLSAIVSSSISQGQIYRLFDLIPGFDYIHPSEESGISYRMTHWIVEYNNPEAAAYAFEKLDGFEYPPGEPITLKPELNSWRPGGGGGKPAAFLLGKRGGYDMGFDNDNSMHSKLATLTQALAEATTIIKSAGLSAGSIDEHCSANLPPPKPIVKDEKVAYRLFIVCQPEAPPVQALKDVFCRFGGLVDAYLLPNRNCGYVLYSNEDSAKTAIQVMHNQELYGNRMKVIEADPPRGTDVKRMRYNN